MPRAEQRAPSRPVWAEWHSWLIQLLAASCVIGKAKGNDPSFCVLLMSRYICITLTSGWFGSFLRGRGWEERQELVSNLPYPPTHCTGRVYISKKMYINSVFWLWKGLSKTGSEENTFSVIWCLMCLNYTDRYAPMCLMTFAVLNKCVDTAVKLFSVINRNENAKTASKSNIYNLHLKWTGRQGKS